MCYSNNIKHFRVGYKNIAKLNWERLSKKGAGRQLKMLNMVAYGNSTNSEC